MTRATQVGTGLAVHRNQLLQAVSIVWMANTAHAFSSGIYEVLGTNFMAQPNNVWVDFGRNGAFLLSSIAVTLVPAGLFVLTCWWLRKLGFIDKREFTLDSR